DMEKKGSDTETIRKETGWFRGLEGKWRFEINDNDMTINYNLMDIKHDPSINGDVGVFAAKLDKAIDHPRIFYAYPELKKYDITLFIHPMNKNTGYYRHGNKKIGLQPKIETSAVSKGALKDIVLHELQHAIQEIEGFVKGGSAYGMLESDEIKAYTKELEHNFEIVRRKIESLKAQRDRVTNKKEHEGLLNKARLELQEIATELKKYTSDAYDKYQRLAGEIEARDVALMRGDLTPEQRLMQKPYIEVDTIGKENVIVKYNSDGSAEFSIAPSTPIKEKPKIPSLYEKKKDDWFGNKDWAATQATVEAKQFEKRIQDSISAKPKFFKGNYKRWTQPLRLKWEQEWQDIDRAIHIYIDMKRNPDHIDKFYDDLSKDQKRIVDLAQNLNAEQKTIADDMQAVYKNVGLEALDAGIIHNVLENYVARTWNLETQKQRDEFFRKFGTSTRHAKHRTLDTIIEGWARGFELKIEGATNNLQTLKVEIANTVENKKLIQEAIKIKNKDGNKLFSFANQQGYDQINHPNFTWWDYSGTLETDPEAEIKAKQDRDLIITSEGTILKRKRIYAPKKIADNLNNILGSSTLMGESGFKKGISEITKYNAAIKAMILQTSLFHHLAFTNSFVFGGALESLKDVNVVKSYKKGLKALEELQPEVELLVRNGLTIGQIQDWNENFARQKTGLTKILDKTSATKAIKEKIILFQEKQARSLFQRYGAGLKVYTALLEYKRMLKHHPEMEPNERAKLVANLTNDDFGGLHLGRMGRDPTAQHVFRLLALAPDWTESNVRSMIKAIKAGSKEETRLYRRFWGRVVVRGMGLTIAANLLLALWDEDDEDKNYKDAVLRRYKTAWDKGYLKWMDVDITPIYRVLGGAKENRAYFSLIGHFRDPVKFVVHPITSAQHKGSVFFRIFYETLKGTDWRGRPFTTWDELIGVDDMDWSPNYKGLYKTSSKKFGYKKGDSKGGRLKGQLTKSKYQGRGGPISYEKIPSWMLHELRQMTPIQVQNMLGYINGELDGVEAIGKSLGLRITVSEPSKTNEVKPITPSKKRKLRRKRLD
ncbi:MAG: LPD23 domain-containing protein, partial [Nanoarchaeota archaeon]